MQLLPQIDKNNLKEQIYLVISVEVGFSETSLQCLTPHMMQWNDRTWVMDLSSCLTYWQKMAHAYGCEWQEVIRRILEHEFGEGTYAAILGVHPWPALLLAEDMQRKNLQGFVDLSQRFTQNLYQQVSWESWLQVAQQVGEHFEAHKVRRFRQQSLRTNLAHLQRTVERLGFEQVSDLKGTHAYAMRRRFGPVIKTLWQWSEGDFHKRIREPFYDFPWRTYTFRQQPTVKRHLEHAMHDWDQLSEYVREDLNRLCVLPQWSAQDKVLCLEWEVVLHDLKTLIIPIFFRHPHSLHQDSPDQKTALLQAYYRFRESMDEYAASLDEVDEFKKPLIVSWTLKVTETLRMPMQIKDLFGERSNDEKTLAALENRVSVPLHAYEIRCDHQPEDSFAESFQVETSMTPYEQEHFHVLARRRPILIYKKPRPIRSKSSKMWRFLERTMNKWWANKVEESALHRDYYRMTDEQHRQLWVYKDSGGKWFIHGVFA